MDNQVMYEIQIILTNEFGEWKGRKAQLNQEQYNEFIEMSKTFYVKGGFELTCEDGSFLVFPPEITKKSILKIDNKIIINDV